MSDFNSEIFQFWGKADVHHTLPAVCHMLDVAFVAKAIIQKLPEKERHILLQPFLAVESIDEDAAIAMAVLLIALHDIGKLTPGFQYKLKERVDALFDTSKFTDCEDAETKHGNSGFVILHNYFCKQYSVNANAARVMLCAVASHHGVFVANKKECGLCGDEQWRDIQTKAIEWLADYFSVDLHCFNQLQSKAFTPAWLSYIAGLCSVADWIGSDASQFNYCAVNEYNAGQRMDIAHALVGFLNIKQVTASKNKADFAEVFGFKPNALQLKVLALIKQKELPWIAIIESGMGSGKTEAAQVLADHFIRHMGHSGLYVAMPSQATANQLFKRTLRFLNKKELGYQNIEAHLKHSNADFEPQYEALRLKSIDYQQHGATHSVVANQWFTAKKHGLLAGVCVGTVDQLLMAAMLYKHNFVRLFGLANKVLILDEVHSLQSFQLDLLKNTLQWMAKLQVRVIILSATLPRTMLVELIHAYAKTCKQEIEVENSPYPRITTFSSGQLARSYTIVEDQQKNEDSSRPPASYHVQLHETTPKHCVSRMADDVLTTANKAGCGVFVCILNTVNKVQELSEIITKYCDENKASNIEHLTFHAKYPLATRLSIEELIEHRVGKHPTDHQRINPNRPVNDKCLILIGSQVLEQSLDYDACEMFTQIAPIDLLLQRVGRVWRHQINNSVRSEFVKAPKLNIYLPSMDKIPQDYGEWFGHGEVFIYPSHLLAVTTRLLWEACEETDKSTFQIDINQDMDDWINKVYADVDQQVTWLEQEYDKAFEFRLDKRTQYVLAKRMMFDASKASVRDLLKYNNSEIENDEVVLSTRLTSISVQLIFVVDNGEGQLIPVTELLPYKQKVQTLKRVENECKELAAIDWRAEQRLKKSDIARLKQAQISISHSKWVTHFQEQEEHWPFTFVSKEVWQRSLTLFNCVPVILDQNLTYPNSTLGELRLDPKLGLIVRKV
ncbi:MULTISPECIES: CRISPR-associated helicase/endonuclease Cas3 [Pseudoalteromonas]|uniref:CRISPR-associated helicase/endonuclease Cas3 n=1 Tax=Pseudoalteromonas amylolytica TaxID=1859457 RepID=A0A1S1MU20_9GAMM|nr:MULTISPECIES: CRISPR-associated helicase/endonuclease Cas3 [Pseudoalteromonas]OHU85068.1 CRISPR-associated helicase/endonuclease Cas3 [Pseudoalteromonas sp. JW3]OHU89980.1 CRISPR-associated helicase/endonuclease Cas3 [Pseudoalteromonas amylolytica]